MSNTDIVVDGACNSSCNGANEIINVNDDNSINHSIALIEKFPNIKEYIESKTMLNNCIEILIMLRHFSNLENDIYDPFYQSALKLTDDSRFKCINDYDNIIKQGLLSAVAIIGIVYVNYTFDNKNLSDGKEEIIKKIASYIK